MDGGDASLNYRRYKAFFGPEKREKNIQEIVIDAVSFSPVCSFVLSLAEGQSYWATYRAAQPTATVRSASRLIDHVCTKILIVCLQYFLTYLEVNTALYTVQGACLRTVPLYQL